MGSGSGSGSGPGSGEGEGEGSGKNEGEGDGTGRRDLRGVGAAHGRLVPARDDHLGRVRVRVRVQVRVSHSLPRTERARPGAPGT